MREANSRPAAALPTISAVIPVHNREHLIGRAIESALDQTRPADEIVVVDDGSTDATTDVVRRFGDAVKLICKPNGGVSTARNLGVEQSSSEFIAFLDSDDVWESGHLRRMDDAISGTGRKAVLYFSDLGTASNHPGETYWERAGLQIDGPYELRSDPTDWVFSPIQPMVIDAVVVRRDVYLETGGSDARLVRRGDTHLLFKLGLAGPVCAVAGSAGDVTRDAETSIITTFPPEHRTYIDCTIWLYRDLLGTPSLTRSQRRVLVHRLADGYWALAKHHGAKAPLPAILNVARASRLEPSILPARIGNRLRHLDVGAIGRSPHGAAE
jgi:glycosyltransferase involved in cell wall biosynthesis